MARVVSRTVGVDRLGQRPKARDHAFLEMHVEMTMIEPGSRIVRNHVGNSIPVGPSSTVSVRMPFRSPFAVPVRSVEVRVAHRRHDVPARMFTDTNVNRRHIAVDVAIY